MITIQNNKDGTIRKLKGDIGVLIVSTVLLENGLNILLPYGDRLPYDLVVEYDGAFRRLQVKYYNSTRDGLAAVKMKKRPSSTIEYNSNTVDAFAIYCPATKLIAFVNMSEVNTSKAGLYVRFRDLITNVKTKAVYAKSLTNPLRIFDPTIFDEYTPQPVMRFNPITAKNEPVKAIVKRPYASKERLDHRKVVRPLKEELEKLVWEMPTTRVAERFGVSDKAIDKWCKSYGISKPPRGYWRKVEVEQLKEALIAPLK